MNKKLLTTLTLIAIMIGLGAVGRRRDSQRAAELWAAATDPLDGRPASPYAARKAAD